MGREKLYIKGIETARADELRLAQDSIETVSQDLSSYKEEVDTSLEELKEEVRQIVAEGGEAEPIIISSTGITISVTNNQEALLDALNTLLKKDNYDSTWFTTDYVQTTYNLFPGNTPIIFKLGTQYYNVNRITLRNDGVGDYFLGVSFFLDGSWAADGQTTTDPGMESYYEHVENISYTEFYISKEEYINKKLLNIYSDAMLMAQDYVSMVGIRYYNPINYYQTLTTANEIAYEPTDTYHPATKKYVDDKALISAFTYFLESTVKFGNISTDLSVTLEDAEKTQLTEFINRYRQQKSFLHVTLSDGSRFLCDSLNDIDLNTTTNVFSLTLSSLTNEFYFEIYMEGSRNVTTGEYTVNIANFTVSGDNTMQGVVDSIEEGIFNTIGELDELSTNNKTNLVSAINETYESFTDNYLTKDEVMPAAYMITTGAAINASGDITITDLSQFDVAVNDSYSKGLTNFTLYLKFNASNTTTQSVFTCSMVGNPQLQQTYYEGYYYHSNLHSLRRIYIMGTWSNNTFTTTSAKLSLIFDMWHFVSTSAPSGVTSYSITPQTNFDKAPTITDHSSITKDNHLVDKQYVTEAINAIPGVDLSGYYTSSQVDAKLLGVDTKLGKKQDTLIAGDNITITNNIISASGSSNAATLDSTIPVIDFTNCYTINNTNQYVINTNGFTKLSELFTTHYQQHGSFGNLIFILKGDGLCELYYSATTTDNDTTLYFSRHGFCNTDHNGGNVARLLQDYLTQEYFTISITDATVTCSAVNGGNTMTQHGGSTLLIGLNNNFLNKNNTSSYTPTNNYHPATKKYVDDKATTLTNTINNKLDTKQDTLIAGTNITIENNIISAVNAGGSGEIGDSNLQVSEMPEPTADNEGAIVQYTGNDSNNYNKGYFYRSTADHVYGMDSLTTTGGYANTLLSLGSNYKIEMKVKLNTYISGAYFFGSSNYNTYYCLRVYNGYYAYGLNGASTTSSIPYTTGEDLLLTYNDDEGNITVNDSIIATGIATPTSYGQLQLFSGSSKMTFYYCKVWNKTTGALVAHFVPVLYNGRIAIYNIIGNVVGRWTNYASLSAGTTDAELTQYRYWIPQDIQDFKPDYIWSNALRSPKFYEDMQTIIATYRNKSVISEYSLGGYRLSHIAAGSTSSPNYNDYRLYTLYLSRTYNDITYTRTITLYTKYDTVDLYGSATAYPPTLNTSDATHTYLTSHQSLANYISKTNTTAFTPTGDYHPATKQYVDIKFDSVDLRDRFIAKDNMEEYTPSSPYNPCTKQYAEDYARNLFNGLTELSFKEVTELPSENISMNAIYLVSDENSSYNMYIYTNDNWLLVGTTELDLEPAEIVFEGEPEIINNIYTIENLTSYPFELNDDLFYESTNKGVGNTASVCKITFNNDIEREIPITYINYGQNNYDYGLFSKLDTALSTGYSADDSSLIYKSCYNESSSKLKELTYTIPAGEHFIYIKYRKNNTTNSGNDSLQFKIPDYFITGASYTIDILKGNRIYKLNTLGYLNITEADVFNRETVIFIKAEENGLHVTLPVSLKHLGDHPDFAVNEDGMNQGFCVGGSSYIISIMNNIAVWKVYEEV